MTKAEHPEVRTTNKVEIEIGMLDRTGFLVKLSGELDNHDLRTLHETLSLVLSTGLCTIVDLSGVTFLDVRCARELAARSHLYDHMMLCAPSLEAKTSLKVCCQEARIAAYSREELSLREPSRRTQAQEHAGVQCREASALAV